MSCKYFFAFILVLFVVACEPGNKKTPVAKAPEIIPGNYEQATDVGFSKSQDTVFYHGKLFSGYAFYLFPNRDTAFVMGYLHGLQEGITQKWYPNKQLMEVRRYVAGRKEGIHQGWWPNGKPKFYYELSNDAYIGLVKEWFSNGTLARVFHYKEGQEDGSEKMWWDDGTIRANYVIINGKKFGLSGQKLCTNNNLKQYLK